MKRIYSTVFLIISLVFAADAAPVQGQWTLEECLKYAMENNISVKQADLNRRISKNSYLQSKLGVLPTLTADGTYSFSFGNSINPTTYQYQNTNSQTFGPSLSGSLPLFTGLQQINNINKNKYDALTAFWDQENAKTTTALNITNLFLQLVLNRELVKAAVKQVDISQSQLDVQKSRIKAGTVAEAAIYDFEAQLARDQATVTTQRNSELISLISLKIALQLPDSLDFDVTVPPLEVKSIMTFEKLNPQDVYDYAVKNQPSIKSAVTKTESARYLVKYYKGAISPTLTMSFSLRSNYFNQSQNYTNPQYYFTDPTSSKPIFDASTTPNIVGYDRLAVKYDKVNTPIQDQLSNNFSKSVSFDLNIPLFSGWRKMTNIANSKLQYQVQQLNVETAKNSLKKDIYQSYVNARGNAEGYQANEKALIAQRKATEVTEKKFNAGLATNYELQQSRANLAKTESNAIQAKYNYLFSIKVLDFYQGKPITLN